MESNFFLGCGNKVRFPHAEHICDCFFYMAKMTLLRSWCLLARWHLLPCKQMSWGLCSVLIGLCNLALGKDPARDFAAAQHKAPKPASMGTLAGLIWKMLKIPTFALIIVQVCSPPLALLCPACSTAWSAPGESISCMQLLEQSLVHAGYSREHSMDGPGLLYALSAAAGHE